jgi:hypothetical protein
VSERSLGDPADTEPTPETFDVAAYAAGHRPGRHSVQVRQRLDLLPELEALTDRIMAAPVDANVDALIDEFDALKAKMLVRYVFEQRSPEWVREFYKQTATDMGVKVKNGAKDALRGTFTEDQAVEVALRLIAAQCIEPAGVTVESLQEFYTADPAAVDVLSQAVADVNAQRSEALGLDFSQRRSTSRGTRRS